MWRVWSDEKNATVEAVLIPAPATVEASGASTVRRAEWFAALLLLALSALVGLFPALLTTLAARLAG